MGNIPITSRVLKSSSKGMKVREPLLNVGTVAKQVQQDVNLSGKGGTATIEEKIKKEAAKVSGGNLENVKVERDYSGDGPKTQKEKIAYERHKEKEKTDPCYQYKAGTLKCKEGTVLNPAGATAGDRDTCCAKKSEEKKTCADGSAPDADGNCVTKTEEITITPETQTNKGMGNFDARQQGRKSIQNARKLNKFERKMGKYGTFDKDGNFKANDNLSQKDMRKLRQFQSNRQNFLAMRDSINTQTDQGGFGKNNYTDDKYIPPNAKLYTAQVKLGPDGKPEIEGTSEIIKRVQGDPANANKKDYRKVFQEMGERIKSQDFSINSEKPKASTFFGTGADKPTFKDVVAGIGDNLVSDKSLFAKKDGGTDVGNALRAINPFKKKGPKPSTTEVLQVDNVDPLGTMAQKNRSLKKSGLKKNYFNK